MTHACAVREQVREGESRGECRGIGRGGAIRIENFEGSRHTRREKDIAEYV